MKKVLLLILCVLSAQAVSFSWVSSKISGDGTLPSTKNEVSAHGWDFRSYTYIDPAGRICTAVFTDQKGATLDCEFPPKDFDYDAFMKKMSK
jgi:hypothetical protein